MLPLIPPNLEPHCLTLDLGSWDGFGLGMCFTSSISPEVTEGSPSDVNCLLQQNEDFPRAVLLPSDWGVPHAWIVGLPALRLGLGYPRQELCFPHQTTSLLSGEFYIRLATPRAVHRCF